MAGTLPDDRELAQQILAELRGPRVAAAFACGGLLALAGALMQTLFRNPLAEPYLLGVSGGAGLLALLGMAAGLAWPSPPRAGCCLCWPAPAPRWSSRKPAASASSA
jgi:iron complex transport system permease protein